MKKCPYCAEKIQDEAIVCRYCGHDLVSNVSAVIKDGKVAPAPAPPSWRIAAVIGVVGGLIFAVLATLPRLATFSELATAVQAGSLDALVFRAAMQDFTFHFFTNWAIWSAVIGAGVALWQSNHKALVVAAALPLTLLCAAYGASRFTLDTITMEPAAATTQTTSMPNSTQSRQSASVATVTPWASPTPRSGPCAKSGVYLLRGNQSRFDPETDVDKYIMAVGKVVIRNSGDLFRRRIAVDVGLPRNLEIRRIPTGGSEIINGTQMEISGIYIGDMKLDVIKNSDIRVCPS